MLTRNRRIQSLTVIISTHSKRAYVTVRQFQPYNVWVRDYRITAATLARIERLTESKDYAVMRTQGIDNPNVTILHLDVLHWS